jgi:hypothetical protein
VWAIWGVDFVVGVGGVALGELTEGLPALAGGMPGFGFKEWVGAGAGEGANEREFGEVAGGEVGASGFGLEEGGGFVFEFEGDGAHGG